MEGQQGGGRKCAQHEIEKGQFEIYRLSEKPNV